MSQKNEPSDVEQKQDQTKAPQKEEQTKAPQKEDQTKVPQQEDQTKVPQQEDQTKVPQQEDQTKVPQQEKPERKETEKEQKVRSWLKHNMRILLTDGRILLGKFSCFDNQKNIVLADCVELRKVLPLDLPPIYTKENEEESFRKQWRLERKLGLERKILGLALVPGKFIKKCEIDQNEPISLGISDKSVQKSSEVEKNSVEKVDVGDHA
eukprot:TRINITY_DN386_c0_g1_i1.p1 TRINITY_DN386_c0_g1~~TRINITY_DN386_c0_g1_i1.p1  ORF type:complete len:209 (+),score=77.55 TRINITY_DN386_c0_g1_i1:85-711(+)